MATPESKVKKLVRDLLSKYGAYSFQPVQLGYGPSGLDFHCVINGLAFFVETKKFGKEPTERQDELINTLIHKHKAQVFVIDGYGQQYEALERWLHQQTTTQLQQSLQHQY